MSGARRAKSRSDLVEKSPSATQHCSLSGRFLGYSLREFGLRRPLEMTCRGNVVFIALTASDISILSRANTDVTVLPDVKYATRKTRGEISSAVNRGFLTGRFLDYSLREFGLRRPLEMTYRGNAPLEMTGIASAPTMRQNSTLAFQPVGACIASPLRRRCFPVRV